jgi:hypothetical protein
MAQHDFVIDNGPGAAVRSDMNAALAALASSNSGSTFTGTPVNGQLWWNTTTSVLSVYNQPTTTWLPVATNVTGSYLLKAGDTMTGTLIVKPPSLDAVLELDKGASGKFSRIRGEMNTQLRWVLDLGNITPEGGSNAGSDFAISRFDDGGSSINTPFSISRATGTATFANSVEIEPASGNPTLVLNKAASGISAVIAGQLGGNNRWLVIPGNATAETTNAGSDFQISRYNDAGAATNAFTISRLDGQAIIPGGVGPSAGYQMYLSGSERRIEFDSATPVRLFYNGTSTFLAYGGNNRFTFPSSGNLTIQGDAPAKPTAGGWVTSCDIRIKDDVRDYTRGLEEILQLRPVSYRHKAETGFDSTKIRYGMVAQECEKIMPELVTVEPNGVFGGMSMKDLRTFDPTNLTYALINAVRELADRVESLEGQLTAAKRRKP